MLNAELLPGPSTPVCYIRKYVITEYVITGLYCTYRDKVFHHIHVWERVDLCLCLCINFAIK